jgi:hypothetical protein
LSFVVLEIPTASAVSNLVTYYYYSPVCWSAPREQQHTPHIDFWARHSICIAFQDSDLIFHGWLQ